MSFFNSSLGWLPIETLRDIIVLRKQFFVAN